MEKFYVHYYLGQYLEVSDLIYTPFFIGLVYFLANTFKARMLGNNSPLKKYFIPALSVKMIGALASGLVYQFYYHGGDTMDFYTSVSFIYGLLFEKPMDAIGLLHSTPVWDDPSLAQYSFLPFLYDFPTWTVVRVAAFVDFFSFDSYPVISIYFSLFSLYCTWKFFTLLSRLYPDPNLIRKFAYCLFYIPSVFFWGSGVFKDSLTLSALFIFSYSIYGIIVDRKVSPYNIIMLAMGAYLMFCIRSFFLIILVPCLGFWFFAIFRDRFIKSDFLRSISFPVLLTVSMLVIFVGVGRVMGRSDDLNEASLKEKAEGFQSWHGSLGGSAYDLGMTDFSTASLVRVFPLAVNVTLFRPYVWETHTAFQMISALQSLFFMLYFILTLYRTRLEFFSSITQDSLIMFSITFSVFYAFVTGFTSYNFGALDRYKIPALPFFMIALVLINYQHEKKGAKVR